MIQIDGSMGEGGGQVLRSSLTLSMLTGLPFEIKQIRANRRKPGLMRQHLTAVLAAAKICNAEVSGAELKSGYLSFRPGSIVGGDYHFSIGTAGSTMLVFQTIMAALLKADKPSRVLLEGGTHNPLAPPFEFLVGSFLPVMHRMGADIQLELVRPGFFPAGGGKVAVDIKPLKSWNPLVLHSRGELVSRGVDILHAHLPKHIAVREQEIIMHRFNLSREQTVVKSMSNSRGPGNIIVAKWQYEHFCQVWTNCARIGVPAERIAKDLCGEIGRYLAGNAPVGEYLADQLLLPMALAGGSSILAQTLSMHARTQLEVIDRFLGTKGVVAKTSEGYEITYA